MVGLANKMSFCFFLSGFSQGLRGLLTINNFLMGESHRFYPFQGPYFREDGSLGSVAEFACLQSDLLRGMQE